MCHSFGECGARAIEKNVAPPELYFPIREEEEILLADRKEIIRKIFRETREAKTWYKEEERAEALALGFHEAVSCMVLEMCRRIRERFHEDKVALSGGVFANVILQERCRSLLEEQGFRVYVNEQVPGNDGGIALGQAWLAAERLMDEKDRGGQICV